MFRVRTGKIKEESTPVPTPTLPCRPWPGPPPHEPSLEGRRDRLLFRRYPLSLLPVVLFPENTFPPKARPGQTCVLIPVVRPPVRARLGPTDGPCRRDDHTPNRRRRVDATHLNVGRPDPFTLPGTAHRETPVSRLGLYRSRGLWRRSPVGTVMNLVPTTNGSALYQSHSWLHQTTEVHPRSHIRCQRSVS